MFRKGQQKPAGSGRRGRPVGSEGAKNRTARQICEELGCDPVEALVRIARRRSTPLELRIDCLKSLLKFCWPALSTAQIDAHVRSEVLTKMQLTAIMTKPELADAAEVIALALVPPAETLDPALTGKADEPLMLPAPAEPVFKTAT